jgi:hypothetical protein
MPNDRLNPNPSIPLPDATTNRASQGAPAAGCCGGPAPAGSLACCVSDAEAKAAGRAGCGCGSPAAPVPEATPPEIV